MNADKAADDRRSGRNVRLPAQSGTYVLVLHCSAAQRIVVGRLGEMDVQPGWYVYVGSALGPGGLAARVGRHLATDRPLRWHIDYLRRVADVVEVWYAPGDERRECDWAQGVAKLPGVSAPLPRFGASDCHCPAHLFRSAGAPSFDYFAQSVASIAPGYPRQRWMV
jgi:Uri superfamily endonuclease